MEKNSYYLRPEETETTSEIIGSTYEIVEKIGSGGGGNVFLANHMRLGKKVVLKADKRKITARPELLRREVDTLKDLSHSYIPQVYDFFAEGDTVYTVMDYIEGESLDKPLKRGERFAQPQVIKWARQLLAALCYLHSPTHGDPPRGFVHSDIKPANLMRTRNGDICLIDFNIALALGEENVVGCSAGYASPEHYGLDFSMVGGMTGTKTETQTVTMAMADTDTVILPSNTSSSSLSNASSGSSMKKIVPDVRSDIYSTGATLYHLLCGKRPAKHAKDVVPLSKAEFSPQIVEIISKAMNPNPDLRYQTAEEMLAAFLCLHENDSRVKRFKRNNRVAYTVIGVCFALGVASAFVGLKRIQVVESRLKLIEYSQKALANGDKQAALEYVLETMPEKNGLLTPPSSSQSQKALTDVLGVYDLADGFKKYKTVELPGNPLNLRIAPDGKTAVCIYEGFAAVFDTETAEIMATLPAEKSALAEVRYLDNDRIVYAGGNGIRAYDIAEKMELWSGRPATAIAVSQDGKTVAAIYKDETSATVYDATTGQVKCEADFREKCQNVAENDGFANPNDNLLALNADGSLLAVSFRDGSLWIFDLQNIDGLRSAGVSLEVLDETSGHTYFDGGFYGKYFAFSAGAKRSERGAEQAESNANLAAQPDLEEKSAEESKSCVVMVIDMEEKTQAGGFASEGYCKVMADENGIYVQENNILVRMNPITGEQEPLVDMTGDIRSFDTDGMHTAAVSEDKVWFFDKNAKVIGCFDEDGTGEFVQVSNGVAVSGSLNSPGIKILRYESQTGKEVFRYDASYEHAEARVGADEKTVMLFSYRGFQICEADGTVVAEAEIPDAKQVYDQQYVRDEDGNRLVVTYNDGAILTYDARSGELLSEEEGGVTAAGTKNETSVFEREDKGTNPDVNVKSDTDTDAVYFTDVYRIVAPLHGTPTVYDKESGKRVCELEKDAYLTYVTQAGEYIVTQYAATDGSYYGVLLNEKCEVLAELPYLCDVIGADLYFDYPTGTVRRTHIYNMEELLKLAQDAQTGMP